MTLIIAAIIFFILLIIMILNRDIKRAYFAEEVFTKDDIIVNCPICGVETHSIKQTLFINKTAFAIVTWIRHGKITSCRKCLYKAVHKSNFKISNILLGNIIWLLITLPHNYLVLRKNRKKGHYDNIKVEYKVYK